MKAASVVLVGPASPRDAAHRFSGADADRARTIEGYRGIPVTGLAEALLDSGFQVEVVTTAPTVNEPLELTGPNFRMLIAPRRTRARDQALDLFREERSAMSKLLATTDGEVVHAHWTYEFAWAALGMTRPTLVTAHDAPLRILRFHRDAYRAFRTVMAARVRLSVRNLTAVSPYLASRWRREMLYRRRIAVVPNIAPFSAPGANQMLSSNGVCRIVTVSDSGPRKNVRRLLEAFGQVRATHPTAELIVIGRGLDWSGEVAADARATRLPLEGVEFAGAQERPEVLSALRTATVFVHPSLEECCPMAVLEAMAVGVPVVAGARAGGTPWVLENGHAGVLVDVTDPEKLARGITELLDDVNLAAVLSKRAEKRVEGAFSATAVVAGYSAEYDRILKEPAWI